MTRLIGRGSSTRLPVPDIHTRDHHTISRKDISKPALDVLYGLHKAGYKAFLVGGSLRDLLTGGHPKDFDVATDAPPEAVEKLFRRSRIIGRRFRIVHVYFGRDVIEVATFRALADDHDEQRQSDDGMLLRDNVYGTIEEDALRRDFTINALYYNIADFTLYDFVGSLKDIEKRRIRLIGDPETRYREDPVRMLRAARFAAKMQFDIDPATEKPIHQLNELLYQVPAARLFDEVLKLFLGGYARQSLASLQQLGLLEILFPSLAHHLHDSADKQVWQRMLEAAMDNTDARLARGKPVTPAFLYAVLLWPDVRARYQQLCDSGMPAAPAMNKAATAALQEQLQVTSIPKRFSSVMRDIWALQTRLHVRHGNRAEALVTQPKFRAGYDFLLLREESGELEPGLGDWWTRYQDAHPDQREAMASKVKPSGGKPRRKRRRRRKPRPDSGGDD
ncbi:MAG: polynucleotide adenylyltransferase PcnB [Alcanivoracaceae bacterium]|jgi:poly(A) polymerase|nr:polynucleotide adenylyltransferase PcnB [Alcanivoracaceae bacterium]